MTDENSSADASTIDSGVVRSALSAELATRGHRLSGDTAGAHRPLYIMGPNDVARMVFEFKETADDAACELMYQGAWVAGMPPRFVVLPSSESGSPSLETLVQMKATPLLFDTDAGGIRFRDLDEALSRHLTS